MKERELEERLDKYIRFVQGQLSALEQYVGLYNMDNSSLEDVDWIIVDINTETEAMLKLIGRRQRSNSDKV